MEKQDLRCPVCSYEFDNSSHVPRIITSCGHSICSECINKSLMGLEDSNHNFVCPIDKTVAQLQSKDMSHFPKNLTLIALFEKVKEPAKIIPSDNVCTIHGKPTELICMDDKKFICFECAIFGAHVNHNVKKYSHLQQVLEEKVSQLEQVVKRIEKQEELSSSGLDVIMEAKKQQLIDKATLKVNEYVNLILNRKLEVLKEINEYFENIKHNITNFIESESEGNTGILKWKDKVKKKIDEYKKSHREGHEEIHFSLLEEDLSAVLPLYNKWVFQSKDEIKKNAETKIDSIDVIFQTKLFEEANKFCAFKVEGKSAEWDPEVISRKGSWTIQKKHTMNKSGQKSVQTPVSTNSMAIPTNQATTMSMASSSNRTMSMFQETPSDTPDFTAQRDRGRNTSGSKEFNRAPSLNPTTEPEEDTKIDRRISLSKDFLIASTKLSSVGLKLDWETKGGITFSVSVENTEIIGEKSLQEMANTFTRFSFLTILQLDFSAAGNKINDGGMYHVGTMITKLIGLNRLEVFLSYSKSVYDVSLHNLGIAASSLSNLSFMSFNFQGCKKITNNGIEKLTKDLKRTKNLQTLKLAFEGCEKITDDGIEHLAEIISVLNKLERLEIQFSLCSKIEGSSLISLGKAISLKNLKGIVLNFANCEQLKDEATSSLCLALMKFQDTLETLEINFSDCKKLTDSTANVLSQVLSRLRKLEELELYLSRCRKLSVTGLVSISMTIPKLENLKAVKLFFKDCGKLTNTAIDQIKKSVEHISNNTLFIQLHTLSRNFV